MTLWLYYRKSIDKMVLLNDDPCTDWKEVSRDKDSELYLGGSVTFTCHRGQLVKRGEGQDLVAWAHRIDAYED